MRVTTCLGHAMLRALSGSKYQIAATTFGRPELQALSQHFTEDSTPVVAMTSMRMNEIRSRGLDLGSLACRSRARTPGRRKRAVKTMARAAALAAAAAAASGNAAVAGKPPGDITELPSLNLQNPEPLLETLKLIYPQHDPWPLFLSRGQHMVS